MNPGIDNEKSRDRMIHVAIPVLNENDWLFACLQCLADQTIGDYRIWICVNQPDAWWDDPLRQSLCRRNEEMLHRLGSRCDLPLHLVDRCSRGRGWAPGQGGVGQARKVLLDEILASAGEDDLFVSLDADTSVEPDYLETIRDRFHLAPSAAGMALPYFHPLPQNREQGRHALRYEIYLRHYLLGLLKIGSPWAFTALGSAIAASVSACRRVGGFPPRESGEDFYFLQKLRKFGPLLLWNKRPVYPAARSSDRVNFGTGPAIRSGMRGGTQRYPLFAVERFRELGTVIRAFDRLHQDELDTPLSPHYTRLFGTTDPWGPLRRNHPDCGRFVRACHERLNGLRTFQYLRLGHQPDRETDEERLLEGARWYAPELTDDAGLLISEGGFGGAPIELIDRIRQGLADREARERARHDFETFGIKP